MPAVDVASKPTLASYNIRPDAFDPRRPGPPNPLQTAKGRDEAMLAVLDRHSEVADAKIKTRDFKGAITLLRRTYALVHAHSSPAPDKGKALVVRLAGACLKLQLCAALSRIGRHGPALDEAKEAKQEMEEVWEALTGSAVEMAMAEAGGDTTKPHPVLRSHICNPPSWLERAVACSIQSRLCMALEMEYLLRHQGGVQEEEEEAPPPPLLPPIEGDRFMGALQPTVATDEMEFEGQVGMPTRPHSKIEQIEQLYREAIDLAAQLLPPDHSLALDAEKAAASAALRRSQAEAASKEVPAPAPSSPAGPPVSPAAASSQPSPKAVPPAPVKTKEREQKRVSLPEVEDDAEPKPTLPPRDLLTRNKRQPTLRRCLTEPSLSQAQAQEEAEEFLSKEEKEGLMRRSTDSHSHGDWVRRSPPGDVFYRSLPWSFKESIGGSRQSSRRRKKKKAAMQQEGLSHSTESFEHDPFKDWAKQYMHVENMTLFQRKLLTLEGITSLHTDMKIETKRFRQFMHDLEVYGGEDRLGHNRLLFSDAGMKAYRAGQLRHEAVRKAAWKATPYAQQFNAREKELFGYYGMSKQYEKGVDVKSLRRIMEESFARTPAEKARRKAEEEQKRRQEQEEAEQKKRELAKIGFRKSRTKSTKERMTASR